MPNRKTHVVVGAIAGAGYAAKVSATPDLPLAVGAAGAGAFGGAFPDLVDPPNSPLHRNHGHSVLTGALLALAAAKLEQSGWDAYCQEQSSWHYSQQLGVQDDQERIGHALAAILWRTLRGVPRGFVAGYLSHLGMDALTPSGLPLVGRPQINN